MYHVGNGGMLDSSTVGLLSRPRCGNPDNIMEEPQTDYGLQISSASRPRRRASQEYEASQSDRDVRNVNDPEVQTNSYETNRDQTDKVPDQEMLKKVANQLRKAMEARHPKSDSHLEWEPHPEVVILTS